MQPETNSNQKKKSLGKIILKRTLQFFFISFVLILIVAVGAVGVGAGLVSAYTKDEKIRTKEDFEKELSGWSQNSYAYFRPANGSKEPKRIGELVTSDYRVLIKDLDDVSPYLQNAFISVEDREFYQHNGISLKGIARAAYQQISGSEVTTGGSTLTQQLIKNELFNQDRTKERKAKEIVNAIRLEKYYDKEPIFVAYMNSVYFGYGAHNKNMYGVASAAKGIFNKNVKDLNLAQAAYIAGMVQRPNDYNPVTPRVKEKTREENLKRGMDRMKLVLNAMLINKKITKHQYDEALKFDIKKSLAKPSDFTNAYEKYPYVVSAVQREAAEILKAKDKDHKGKNDKYYQNKVAQGGYHIYTTIDQQLYDEMNNALKGLPIPKTKINGKIRSEQIGAVLMDNKTGAVLAFYAGTNFKNNQKDFALGVARQPASAIKPLLGYGPAIDLGIISPDSIIIDEEIPKADGSGYYRNYGKNFHNAVTATEALKQSYNIPAVKVFRAVKRERGFSYLRKMGMQPSMKYDFEASILGGFHNGFTVEQMAGGYATIANGGVYNKPHIIERIIDSNGNEIYNYQKENKPVQVFKPSTAYQLTQMLREVVTSGTATKIGNATSGYFVAGKTGTATGEHNLWFMGYTPEVTIGVWSGYDYPTTGEHFLSQNAWIRFFKAVASARPDLIPKGTSFTNPGGLSGFKCFECNRVPSTPAPTPGQPPAPGQPPTSGQPPTVVPPPAPRP